MNDVIHEHYPDGIRPMDSDEVEAISVPQYVPKAEWGYDISKSDDKAAAASAAAMKPSEGRIPGLSLRYQRSTELSPMDLEFYEAPSTAQQGGTSNSGLIRRTGVPGRKFRLSRSPLDSLQAEFKKYSIPQRQTDVELAQQAPAKGLREATPGQESFESDEYDPFRPDDIEHEDVLSVVPDWSFVQRRSEVPAHQRISDCPSMTTGSTISSRNSSTRSAKSIRWDVVEQQPPSESGRCPLPECGRVLKDLAAHMLTHQAERPEKCPVETCDYHKKGFARAYDRVKHTITHLKGTMVCGFCPGQGSSSEKVFNRCDVFLKHLVSVHGVEQVPLSRREELYRTGTIKQPRTPLEGHRVATCDLCSEPFDAQGFYEHLRGCALRQVTRGSTELRLEQSTEKLVAMQQALKSKGDAQVDTLAHQAQKRAPTVQDQIYNMDVQEPRPESRGIAELTASSRCLSLTSSIDEVVKSSDEETDWTEDTGTPDSALDPEGLPPLLSPVKRQLVESIMREFHRTFDQTLRSHGGGSHASMGSGYYSGSSGSSTYSSSSFVSRKRSLSGGSSPPPDDNGDDSHKRRRPDPKTGGKQPMPELRFACPYYKRNPGRHQTFTSCRDPGFITVARLKEHLYRRHLLPIQCNRCCATFPNEPTLREHQRDLRGCEIREQIPLEGFDKDQERKLKSKKRSLVFQSEEDKWKGVYRILFPDDSEADMPSPYIEYHPCNAGQTGEPSNVARFQEFSRLELPRLVRRTLEVAVEEEAQPLEEKLRERLVDIVRECQSQLISMFQSTATPDQNVQTAVLTPALTPAGIPPEGIPESHSRQVSNSSFRGFDSFATTAADFIPIPAATNHQERDQPAMKPEPSPAVEGTSGSPDSGYDSTWASAGTSFHQGSNYPPQNLGFGQSTTFAQHTIYAPTANFVENEYVDLGGYYGLFENRNAGFGAGTVDPSWAFVDPSMTSRGEMGPPMGAGPGM